MIDQFLTSQQVYFQLARFTVVVILGMLLTRAILMPLSRRLISRNNPDKKAKHSIENIIALTGLFITFVVALQAGDFGNLVTVLGTITAAITVAIGFGMRDQVSSVVAGIFIHTDNPFVKGDYIKFNDFEGVVKDIRLRATVLNGRNDEKQVVPNNILTTSVVKNLTKGSKTRTIIEVNLSSDKLEEATELLLESTEDHPQILEKPQPKVDYTGMEDEKIVTRLNYWIKDSEEVKSVRSNILEEFNKKAVEKGIFKKEEE